MTASVAAALLLDVGHVILEPSWRAVRAYEEATGTPMPRPADVTLAMDHGWQEEADIETVGDRYWEEVAKVAGLGGIVEMFRVLGMVVPDALFDVDAVALMDDTRAAGRPVGILTNHAYMILGREWFAARREFADLATFIDAAEIGCPKPDPQAYLTAANELGLPPGAKLEAWLATPSDTASKVLATGAAAIAARAAAAAQRQPAGAPAATTAPRTASRPNAHLARASRVGVLVAANVPTEPPRRRRAPAMTAPAKAVHRVGVGVAAARAARVVRALRPARVVRATPPRPPDLSRPSPGGR